MGQYMAQVKALLLLPIYLALVANQKRSLITFLVEMSFPLGSLSLQLMNLLL